MVRVVSINKSADVTVLLTFDAVLKYLSDKKILEYKCVSRLEINSDILNWGDYFFFCRSGNRSDSYLMKRLKKAGKCAVYVLDDDLLNIPENLNISSFMRSSEYLRYVEMNIENSQILASPSKILIDKYGKDKYSILVEEPIIKKRKFREHSGYPIRIGFAGTLSRTDDINIILSDVLIKIKEKYKEKVSIEFMGAKPDFIDKVEGKYYPFIADYDKYLDTLYSLQWDVGLAPLPDTSFHNCKHYIKFIEYSSMGIMSVMSNVTPYTRLKDDGISAIFCDNSFDGWFNAISLLVDDYSNLQKKRYETYLRGNETYSLENCADKLWAQLDKYDINRENEINLEPKKNCLYFNKGKYIASLLLSYLKINGVVNTFKKVCKIRS